MVFTRALTRLIGRLLIGVVLFAQLAVAAYACPKLEARGHVQQAMAMMNGCAGMDMSQDDANLCAEHCKVGQQSNDTARLPVAFTPVEALLYVLPDEQLAEADAESTQPAPDPLLAAAPPPHALLHCVWRI